MDALEPNPAQPTQESFEKLVKNLMPIDQPDPNRKKYEILAVSGGGRYGAYPAGVIYGWTASGTRPVFDVATGVSTGSYVATFAFLGTKYDEQLKQFYTTIRTKDILKERPYVALPFSNSFASAEPLKKLIPRTITAELILDLTLAYHEGRRLYIATTNLDTKRLCVWDVTAIAASEPCDKVDTLNQIYLATAAVPGRDPERGSASRLRIFHHQVHTVGRWGHQNVSKLLHSFHKLDT